MWPKLNSDSLGMLPSADCLSGSLVLALRSAVTGLEAPWLSGTVCEEPPPFPVALCASAFSF